MVTRPTILKGTIWRERAHSPSPGNNLPFPPTPLIGRNEECARASAILQQPDMRLLTLYGPGGVGKTRVALAIAANLIESFPDGVYFVPLQDITEGGLLLSAISQALELYTLPDETILPTLIDSIRDMGALFILDNFEQLIPAAPVLAELMSACPRLKLLVTSRSVLNLRGEQELEVLPLPLPQPEGKSKEIIDLAAIESSPAVQLFVQRARSAKPSFVLDNNNASVIAEICARLDGLPLAMELAAARIKLLSPASLLARLEKRLQVLTGGAQDLPTRQQTLHNAIAWSYDLLTPTEQHTFRMLSIFSGGCTLETAEAVSKEIIKQLHSNAKGAHAGIDMLDATTSLANKSLLRFVENSNEVRVSMLETVREYALEQLRHNDEEDLALHALGGYVDNLVRTAEPELSGPDQVRWLDRLEQEVGNIRVVLEWCIVPGVTGATMARIEMGLGIAGRLRRFWQSRSHLQEGVEWLQILLLKSNFESSAAREYGLCAAGRMAYTVNKVEQSRSYYQQALDSATQRGDRVMIALALMGLGNSLHDLGDIDGALKAFEHTLHIRTDLGDEHGIASALNGIGLVMSLKQDPSAVNYYARSVQAYRRLGDTKRLISTLGNLGRTYLRTGDLVEAEKHVREALDLSFELGDHWDIAYGLLALAELAAAHKNYRRTARLLAAANATYDDLAQHLDRYDTATYNACLEAAQHALGEEAFNAEWAAGLSLDPGAASSNTENTPNTPPVSIGSTPASTPAPATKTKDKAPAGIETELSTREIDVLAQLEKGLPSAQVAEVLSLSLYTVNAHLRNIYSKLNVSSRTAAIRYARDNNLI